MISILIALYTLFMIYLSVFYIDWQGSSIYIVSKLFLITILFLSQLIVQTNYFKKFNKIVIDSAYTISIKLITAVFGAILLIYFIFMPISFGINNLTMVFIISLIYLTMVCLINHFGKIRG